MGERIYDRNFVLKPESGDGFADLSRIPYFSDRGDLPIISEHPELRSDERLKVLIPEWVVGARIKALAKKIEVEASQAPEEMVFGAVLEGGRYLYDQVMAFLPSDLTSRTVTTHLDIKSRYATQTGIYEVKRLPPPEVVNGKIYRVFEGVADTLRTLEILQEVLLKPPYFLKELRVALLVDKVDAHPEIPLPDCVDCCLLGMENKWMVGCGPDTGGRFRNLPYIGIFFLGGADDI